MAAVPTHTAEPTAEVLLAALRAREVSALELVERHLAAVEVTDATLHSFLEVTADAARETARRVDAGEVTGPLAGLPIAHKDVLCTKGVPTTAGSRILEGHRPVYDATVVARCAQAGAISLGKLNTDEFAMGSSTEWSAYGRTGNPHDLERVPGGSSGGPAAAVAAGLVAVSTGSDTGGSVRQPAALCGVVGLKPTYGAVSRYGLIAFASSLDQIGPFGRTVRDAALLYQVIAGHDPLDSTSVPLPEPVRLPTAERLDGVRLGVPWHLLGQGVEPGVREAFDAALVAAEGLGAEVVEVALPTSPHALAAYYLIAPAEASSNLARFDGVRYGHRAALGPDDDLLEMYERTRAEGFGPEVKRRIMLGTYALSAGYYDAYYGQAQRVRTLVAREFTQAFEACDLVAMPTSPTVAFRAGARLDDPYAMYACDALAVPVNLAGLPGISIPCGTAPPPDEPDGPALPVGLQLAGPAFSENRILEAAHALEGALS